MRSTWHFIDNIGTQGSSSNDQVGSSTENNSLEAPGIELKFDYGKKEEDYYFEDEDDGCYDEDDEGSDYELETADYNQLLADKFDHLDLPPGVEATVPWLQKVERDGPGKFKSMSEIEEEIAKKYNFFKQFDTVEDFIDHKYAKNSVGNVRIWHILLFFLFETFFINKSPNCFRQGKNGQKEYSMNGVF